MCDPDKVALDVQDRESLTAALLGVFDSQITGGKRYDLATAGRHARPRDLSRVARPRRHRRPDLRHGPHARWCTSDTLDPLAYAQGYIERFAAEVSDRVRRLS